MISNVIIKVFWLVGDTQNDAYFWCLLFINLISNTLQIHDVIMILPYMKHGLGFIQNGVDFECIRV